MGNFTLPAGRSALNDPARILRFRHEFYGTWRMVADELDYNKGVLYAVANGKRNPSHDLIDRMNSVYGTHLVCKSVKVSVEVCEICGNAKYEPRHRCPGAPTKYKAHPVMRLSKIKRALGVYVTNTAP